MLLRILLFGLVLELATSFDSSDLKTRLVIVNMDGENCVYKNRTFASYYMPEGDDCEEWTCYKRAKTVSVTGCSDPPTGCTRNASSGVAFPQCCEKSCLQLTDATCIAPGNILLADGQAYNSTSPCERYECTNKTVKTVSCPAVNLDPQCSPAFVEQAPFPRCCGIATACSQNKDRRKKRTVQEKKKQA